MKRNSSRKPEIREPSVGERWSEAEGELALEQPAQDLHSRPRKLGRISRRRKGKGMMVSDESTEVSVK